MEVKVVSEKSINGLSIRTDNATEMQPNKGKIAALWQAFDQAVAVDYKNGERVYGVHSNYESDHTGTFSVLAGFDGTTISPSLTLEQVIIPESKYLVFTHKGQMPQIAIDAWTEVWHYFSKTDADHERLFSTDFEYYPNGNEIHVHIAVR